MFGKNPFTSRRTRGPLRGADDRIDHDLLEDLRLVGEALVALSGDYRENSTAERKGNSESPEMTGNYGSTRLPTSGRHRSGSRSPGYSFKAG